VSGSAIDGNSAGEKGGGSYASSSSAVMREGASVSGNTAATSGVYRKGASSPTPSPSPQNNAVSYHFYKN
jgi:hypothetical protein